MANCCSIPCLTRVLEASNEQIGNEHMHGVSTKSLISYPCIITFHRDNSNVGPYPDPSSFLRRVLFQDSLPARQCKNCMNLFVLSHDIYRYADDILAYKRISSLDDHNLFQGDLNAITEHSLLLDILS